VAVTFTGIKYNATNTNSAAASLLMDLQLGTASRFKVQKDGLTTIGNASGVSTFAYNLWSNFGNRILIGDASPAQGVYLGANYSVKWASGSGDVTTFSPDLFLTRRGPANLRFGNTDAAAAVAQTLSVQSVVAGTSNTAGAAFTVTGSQGTGTGAGGSLIFQVAPAGTAGTAQNALATALTVNADRSITVAANASSLAQIAMADRGTVLSIYASAFGTQPLLVSASGGIGINNDTGSLQFGASTDAILSREAAGVLGVRGTSTSVGGAIGLIEQTAPAAPAANGVRIYAEDNGAGKTRLMALFATGVAQQIAIEP
jgi:hypothetical protein